MDVDDALRDIYRLTNSLLFDWLHKLAANRKLVFVASALGSQLAAYAYRI